MSSRNSKKLHFLCWRAILNWIACCSNSGCFAQLTQRGCQLPRDAVHGFSRNGDILIGGFFALHKDSEYQEFTFRQEPALPVCQTLIYGMLSWQQAMIFAIEQINRNPKLLPNVTLGFQIYDSCMVMQKSLVGTFWMLTGQEKPIPNYQCWNNHPPAVILGDAISSSSILMARVLGLYGHPQISYSASSPLLSDRNQFRSFFRTIPNDDFQSRGLRELFMYFGWTWVGLLAEDDDYGQQGVHILHGELTRAGACVAFSENIVTGVADKNAFHIVQVIKSSTTNVIVIFSNALNLAVVLNEMLRQNVTGKVFVATEGWSSSSLLSMERYSSILTGTIGFEIHNGEMPGFVEYFYSFHPSQSLDQIFVREIWEEIFGCKWVDHATQVSVQDNSSKLCNGEEDFKALFANDNEISSFAIPYKIYIAIYAFALSLQDMKSCGSEKNLVHQGTCPDIMDFQPWQLLRYIKKVRFPEGLGTGTFFDEHGDPPAWYDIVNWQRTPQGTNIQVKVGEYDSSAPPGETLTINTSRVRWTLGDTQVPISVCSTSCHPGFRQVAKEGQPICCYQCVQCPQGEISNQTDSFECFRCPLDQWTNEKQNLCISKLVEVLYFDEPLGATLTATSIFCSLVPIVIFGIFIGYRNTPIVRANNRSLSYILLLSLTLCFVCSLAFIGYPTPEKCLLRQVAFGIIFTISITCILAKTIMVVIAFNATKPNSNLRQWAHPQLPYTLICFSTLIQVILCLSWLIVSPPYSQFDLLSKPGIIIAECNEGSAIAFWCMLGYLGFLATVSFIVAFLARNLPDSFNEAKFITFSMLAFISVWISFIPAYLSTKGKYMVAMEVFAILSSSASLVCCIFAPKCWIILFRSEMNTKEHLMGRGVSQKKKM